MGDIATKVLAHDDVPRRAMSSVKLLLDLCGNVLLDVVLFEGSGSDVYGLLLHLLAHVDVLDDGLGTLAIVLGEGASIGAGRGVDFVGHGLVCMWWYRIPRHAVAMRR